LGREQREKSKYTEVNGYLVIEESFGLDERDPNRKTYIGNGFYAGSLEPVTYSVRIDRSRFLKIYSQLINWGISTGMIKYSYWPFADVIPVVTRKALLAGLMQEHPSLSLETNLKELNIKSTDEILLSSYAKTKINSFDVFRDTFMPFIKETVRRKIKIFANLLPEDEMFIRSLSALEPSARKEKVTSLIKQYYTREFSLQIEGLITQYELLLVCSDPEVFNHVQFFRNYSEPVGAKEKAAFWVGAEELN